MYARFMSKIEIIINGPSALTQTGYVVKHRPEIRNVSTTLRFRLAALPDLGVLSLSQSSWAFASQLAEDGVRERLEEIGGPAKATLEAKDVSFKSKTGKRAGQEVRYSHPVLTILGPAGMDDTTGGAGSGV